MTLNNHPSKIIFEPNTMSNASASQKFCEICGKRLKRSEKNIIYKLNHRKQLNFHYPSCFKFFREDVFVPCDSKFVVENGITCVKTLIKKEELK